MNIIARLFSKNFERPLRLRHHLYGKSFRSNGDVTTDIGLSEDNCTDPLIIDDEALIEFDIQVAEYLEREAAEKAAAEKAAKEAAEQIKLNPPSLKLLESMIGLSSVKELTKDIVAHCTIRELKNRVCGTERAFVPNMLFLGNAGTGKTTVAKLVGQVFKEVGLMKSGHFISVTRSDLVAKYLGQSADKTKKVFESALDGILFVDEAYSLFRESSSDDTADLYAREVIDTFVGLMTEYAGRCCVIFAGYAEEMNYMLERANPGLRERFPFKLYFNDFTSEELCRIFTQKALDQNLDMTEGCDIILTDTFNRICANKNKLFANGRVAENFLQAVVLQQERRLFEQKRNRLELSKSSLETLTVEDFQKAAQSTLNDLPIATVKRPIGFQLQKTDRSRRCA